MNTNFYPVKVYSLNYRLYSSRIKANLPQKVSPLNFLIPHFYAVLNLKELRNIELCLSILDIDIEKFSTLVQANDRCNELMYN